MSSSIDIKKSGSNTATLLEELRESGWDNYSQSEMPSRVKHLWRYTRPEEFLSEDIKSSMPRHALGKFEKDFASEEDLKNHGIVFTDLETAENDYNDLVEEYLAKLVNKHFGKFESFNLARWSDGLFIFIPAGIELDKPIYLGNSRTSGLSVERVLVIVGENSKVSFVDDTFQDLNCVDDKVMVNRVLEVYVKRDARVNYLNLNRLGYESHLFHTERTHLDQGASFQKVHIAAGGSVSKVNSGVILDGKQANSKIFGVVVGERDQSFDYHLFHHHKSGQTFSDIKFRASVDDEAVSTNTGLIRIEAEADGCEAFQENRNLMLSENARVNSIPELEIINDDVSCSHGVTAGQIDPEMVYYLSSRGIDPETAEKMIVEGFLNSIVALIPEEFRAITKNLLNPKQGENEDG